MGWDSQGLLRRDDWCDPELRRREGDVLLSFLSRQKRLKRGHTKNFHTHLILLVAAAPIRESSHSLQQIRGAPGSPYALAASAVSSGPHAAPCLPRTAVYLPTTMPVSAARAPAASAVPAQVGAHSRPAAPWQYLSLSAPFSARRVV